MFYLLMCLQLIAWHQASGRVHNTKQACVLERNQHAERCRCEPYIIVLEQRGDD